VTKIYIVVPPTTKKQNVIDLVSEHASPMDATNFLIKLPQDVVMNSEFAADVASTKLIEFHSVGGRKLVEYVDDNFSDLLRKVDGQLKTLNDIRKKVTHLHNADWQSKLGYAIQLLDILKQAIVAKDSGEIKLAITDILGLDTTIINTYMDQIDWSDLCDTMEQVSKATGDPKRVTGKHSKV